MVPVPRAPRLWPATARQTALEAIDSVDPPAPPPATMKLLGRYNWYLPRWLRWLPQISPATPPPTAGQPPRQPVTVA